MGSCFTSNRQDVPWSYVASTGVWIARSLLHIGPYEVPRRTAAEVRAWLLALVSADAGEGDSEADPGLLALIKASASTVSLALMLTEISRLEAVRAIGLPAGLFADVASRPGLLAKSTRGRSLVLLHGGDDLGGRYSRWSPRGMSGRACRGSRA